MGGESDEEKEWCEEQKCEDGAFHSNSISLSASRRPMNLVRRKIIQKSKSFSIFF